jgi:hypothetical protein
MFNSNANEFDKLIEKAFLAGLSCEAIKGNNTIDQDSLQKDSCSEVTPTYLLTFPRGDENEPTILDVNLL